MQYTRQKHTLRVATSFSKIFVIKAKIISNKLSYVTFYCLQNNSYLKLKEPSGMTSPTPTDRFNSLIKLSYSQNYKETI